MTANFIQIKHPALPTDTEAFINVAAITSYIVQRDAEGLISGVSFGIEGEPADSNVVFPGSEEMAVVVLYAVGYKGDKLRFSPQDPE